MKRFLISFDDGAMDHLTEDDLAESNVTTREVVAEAKRSGVWIFGGGLARQQASVVDTDGSVRARPFPEPEAVLGGFCVIEVETHEDALEWAAKLARTCRCAQDVREIMYDPES